MNRHFFLIFASSFVIACVPKHDSSEIIPIPDSIGGESLCEQVSSINLIPLSSQDEGLMGQMVELQVWDKTFVIADKSTVKILRFSEKGEYLNGYGRKGRGPQEYASIENIQIKGDTLIVFADHSRILKFLKDGTWLSTTEQSSLGLQSYFVDDAILTYKGYMSDGESRMALIKDNQEIGSFLKTQKSVVPLVPRAALFSESSNGIFFTDSYSNIVNRFVDGVVEPYFTFDFGRLTIGEQFYRFDNRMEGMKFLLGSEFEVINHFCADGDNYMIEAMVQAPQTAPIFNYGICRRGRWKWFTCGETGVDPFSGMFLLYKGDVAYYLLEPSLVGNIPDTIISKIKNAEVLENITQESNYVLAEVYFL